MPKISIIIPAYNTERYIKQSVTSALAQSGIDLEVIVIDDASSDSTRAQVRSLAAADRRVRLISHPTNCGPAKARNLGLAAARGEWIGLLDADDFYAPSRLSTLLALAERYRIDLIADNQTLLWKGDTDHISIIASRRAAPPSNIAG